MAIAVGTGTAVVFGTSSFAPSITSLTISDLTNVEVDTTHLGTSGNGRTSIPGSLYDPGSLDMEFQHPDGGSGTIPPIVGVAETITITFPSTKTLAFSGYLTSWTTNIPTEDLMTGSATFKISGAHTWGA